MIAALSLMAIMLGTSSAGAFSGGVISAGQSHTCGVDVFGAAKCWGEGANGRLGNGAMDDSNTAVAVTGLGSGVTAISAGSFHTCAIVAGAAKCWGNGLDGKLGNAGSADENTPVQVSGLTSGVTAISAGSFHTCAIVDGAVKCWGNGLLGQLGDGNATNSSTPVQVSGLTSGVKAISAGGHHTCAIDSAGAAKCWGFGQDGRLGSGSSSNELTPYQVNGLTSGVTSISAGNEHTCAIASGLVKCWGRGDDGRLGVSNNADTNSPGDSVIGVEPGASGVSAGGMHACAYVAGAAKCWGADYSGQLGNAGDGSSGSAVAVEGLGAGVTEISAGGDHTCAIVSGVAKCWGAGESGQLGVGGNDGAPSPVAVSNFIPLGGTPPPSPGGNPPVNPIGAGNQPALVGPTLKKSGSAKVRGKNVAFKMAAGFAIPAGHDAQTACSGKLKASTKPKGVKKSATASGKLKASGTNCTATLSFKLPKKFKGKQVKVKLSFAGNAAVANFSKTIKFKVR